MITPLLLGSILITIASASAQEYLGQVSANPYSPTSANNPYAVTPPIIIGQ